MPVVKLTIDGVDYTCAPSVTGPTGPTGATGSTGPTGATAVVTAKPPTVPANATKVNMLTPPNPWQYNHDDGTPGDAKGSVSYPATAPDGTKNCMMLTFNISGKGGFIVHGLSIKSGAHNYNRFRYSKKELIAKGAGALVNFETDLEITDPSSGIPYDMATQQDGYSKVVDISINHKWTGTGVKVAPLTRKNGEWHTSEVFFGYDASTHKITIFGETIDGVYNPINKEFTDPDASAWGKDEVNVQLQYDSNQANATDFVVYVAELEIDHWKE